MLDLLRPTQGLYRVFVHVLGLVLVQPQVEALVPTLLSCSPGRLLGLGGSRKYREGSISLSLRGLPVLSELVLLPEVGVAHLWLPLPLAGKVPRIDAAGSSDLVQDVSAAGGQVLWAELSGGFGVGLQQAISANAGSPLLLQFEFVLLQLLDDVLQPGLFHFGLDLPFDEGRGQFIPHFLGVLVFYLLKGLFRGLREHCLHFMEMLLLLVGGILLLGEVVFDSLHFTLDGLESVVKFD